MIQPFWRYISTSNSRCLSLLIPAGAGCEGGGVVTRHTLHSALRANCSPAAAGLHEMAGHSDTQCKTEIRLVLSDSFLRDECFIQPIICFEKISGTILIPSLSFRFDTRRSFRLRYPLVRSHRQPLLTISNMQYAILKFY